MPKNDRRPTRVQVAAATGLVVVAVLLALLFAYPFSPTERGVESSLPYESAAAPWTSNYTIELELTTDAHGGTETAVPASTVVDGDRVHHRETNPYDDGNEVGIESYYEADREWVTMRWTTADAERADSWNGSGDGEVEMGPESGQHVLVDARQEDQPVADWVHVTYRPYVLGTELRYAAFERTDERTYAGRTAEVFEIDEGWYDDASFRRGEYRLIDSSGEVYVDEATDTLLYADVEYTYVEGSNYWEYLDTRLRGSGEEFTVELSYEFREGGEAEAPDWAVDRR